MYIFTETGQIHVLHAEREAMVQRVGFSSPSIICMWGLVIRGTSLEIRTTLDLLCAISAVLNLEVFFLLPVFLFAKYFRQYLHTTFFLCES